MRRSRRRLRWNALGVLAACLMALSVLAGQLAAADSNTAVSRGGDPPRLGESVRAGIAHQAREPRREDAASPDVMAPAAPVAGPVAALPRKHDFRALPPGNRNKEDKQSCDNVRKNLRSLSAQGKKSVTCFEWGTAEKSDTAKLRDTIAPSGNGHVWCEDQPRDITYVTRTSICEHHNLIIMIVNTLTGMVLGSVHGRVKQEINTSASQTQFDDYFYVTVDAVTSIAETGMTMKVESECGPASQCSQGTGPWVGHLPISTGLSLDGMWLRSWTGTTNPEELLIQYHLHVVFPGATSGSTSWGLESRDFTLRCDNIITSFAGCVVPRFTPTFTVSHAYPAAREYIGRVQHSLSSHLGWEGRGSPLHREGDPAVANANRNKVCDSTWVKEDRFGGKPAGDPLAIECDEWPFAATKESGGQIGIGSGKECQQWTIWPGGTGDWKTVDFPAPAYAAPHGTAACARASMPRRDNGGVGGALSSFYQTNRVLNNDPFWVDSGAQYINTPQKTHSPQTCTVRTPAVSAVQPAASPQSTFSNYASSTSSGWTGGDSTYSVKLPDGRLLWLFSDTFLGPLNPNGTRPISAPFVNNSFVMQDGSNLTTITGGSAANPKSIMPPESANHWFWLGGGKITTRGSANYLQVIFHEWHKFGAGVWDFAHKRNVVATFSLSNLTAPISVEPLPSTQKIQWGSGITPSTVSGDGYTYIYGVDDAGYKKKMHIARVKGGDLSSVWEFYDKPSNRWVLSENQAAPILTGVSNEYSVTPWNGQFILFAQNSNEAFSAQTHAFAACDPAGPFLNQTLVYTMPETGPWGSYQDSDVFAYNAHIHPSLTRNGNNFTFSYNVNSMDNRVDPLGAHYRDPSIYKPRWVSFTLN